MLGRSLPERSAEEGPCAAIIRSGPRPGFRSWSRALDDPTTTPPPAGTPPGTPLGGTSRAATPPSATPPSATPPSATPPSGDPARPAAPLRPGARRHQAAPHRPATVHRLGLHGVRATPRRDCAPRSSRRARRPSSSTQAHIELAKAEMAEIAGEIGRALALGSAAFVVVTPRRPPARHRHALFLGEWLFGSMGWGIVHGLLLFTSIALVCVLLILRVPSNLYGRAAFLGIVVAALASLVLGLGLLNRLYATIGEATALAVNVGIRPLVVGLIVGGLVGLLAGIFLAATMNAIWRWPVHRPRRFGCRWRAHRRADGRDLRPTSRYGPRDHPRLPDVHRWSWRPASRGKASTWRHSRLASIRTSPSTQARRRSSGYRDGCRPGPGPSGADRARRGVRDPRSLRAHRSRRPGQGPQEPGQSGRRRGRHGIHRARRPGSSLPPCQARGSRPVRTASGSDAATGDREDAAFAGKRRRQGPRNDRTRLRRLYEAGAKGSDPASDAPFVAVLRPLVLRASKAAAEAVFSTDEEGFQARLQQVQSRIARRDGGRGRRNPARRRRRHQRVPVRSTARTSAGRPGARSSRFSIRRR